ncbi:MAG: hypothetical protein ABIB71_02530 [Candidatus Woesearchaeota archaeon]
MYLLKLQDNQVTVIPKDRFDHREKELQSFVSSHIEDILNAHFIKNEYWVSLDPDKRKGSRSLDGRIDTIAITANGTPLVIEYKERGSKNMFTQGLFYAAMTLLEQNDIETAIKDLTGRGYIDLDIAVNPKNKRKIVLISEKHNPFDLFAPILVRDDFEVLLKNYQLFTEQDMKYFYLYETPRPKAVKEAFLSLPRLGFYSSDELGNGSGLFIESGEEFIVPQKRTNNLDLQKVMDKNLGIFYTEHCCNAAGMNIAVDPNGRLTIISYGSEVSKGIEAANALLKDREKLQLKKEADWNTKPRLIFIAEGLENKIEEIAFNSELTIEPYGINIYRHENTSYLLVHKLQTEDSFKTFPNRRKVYDFDSYSRNIKDEAVRAVLPKLMHNIRRIDRDVDESFNNRQCITYSTAKEIFALVEPRNEWLSLKLCADVDIPKALREEFSTTNRRLRVKTESDIEKIIPIIKEAYKKAQEEKK